MGLATVPPSGAALDLGAEEDLDGDPVQLAASAAVGLAGLEFFRARVCSNPAP